ncbi:hypothetical protein AXX17_AT5G59290 [Arabidopsis thaliana]|uniref:RRM domain-containing protein n=1 Tax=Arabidopsis thaliana TaxID=3702 RepID=A0A178UGV1_ARATH|nr:hypothetical protein AXX17_AT5G59290 [Arabidopsis thaliana]
MLQLCTSPVFLLFSVFEFLFSNCSLAGLSAYTTDQSLRQLFAPFGQITEARLIKDQQTQRPKSFGFITFESEDDAQKALKALNGKVKIHFFNLHSLLKCSMYLWL